MTARTLGSDASSFIAPGDFTEGDDEHPPTGEPPQGVGHSRFTGFIVFTNVARAIVTDLLPKGLRLACNSKHPGFHPILHIVGEQGDTGWSFGSGPEHHVDQPYNEFILLVPFVLQPPSMEWHNFVVRIYLNSKIAKELGKLFAYRKKIGFVDFDATHPRSSSLLVKGNLAFSSDDQPGGSAWSDREAETAFPNYPEMKRIMRMPVLGVDPKSSTRVCSFFKWNFDAATIMALESAPEYASGFNPPRLVGETLNRVDNGAMLVTGLKWTLALPPLPCEPAVAVDGAPGAGLHDAEPRPTGGTPPELCSMCGQPLTKGAKFCAQCGAQVKPAGQAEDARRDHDGERRQASVAFVDLIGSTTLASTMDPEALRKLLRDFRRAIEQAVVPYGGMIAQYFGDGVLIFFGYPTAREDAAEQAVGASLEVVRAVHTVDSSGVLRVRIGVATGIVVASDVGDKPFSLGDVAIGGPLWLAARLQGAAPVDGVVISEETYKVAGHHFECRPMGGQALKGFAADVPVWLVVDQQRAHGRFAARRALRGPSPIVGRDAEVEALLAKWEEVKASGRAGVVAIVGDAGMGKSRLAEALHERIAAESFVSLQYHCAPRFKNTALYPVIAQLERAAGLERDDPPAAKLQKLEELLARSTTSAALPESVAYIASLLSIPSVPAYPSLPETPDRRKEGLLATLQAQLVTLAGDAPLLLLVEDWHWSDPSTQELMKRAIRAVADRPAMVVVTSRTDIASDWSSVEPVVIHLSRLADQHCGSLIEHVAGGRALPKRFVDQVLRKAEGVPLYVEEITKSLIDSGAFSADASGDAADSLSLAVPSSLRDLILARLDSLARAKEVAQVGSAVGREFSYPLLKELLPASETDLRAALEALVHADVVQRRGTYPDAHFLFRHTLIQDASYDTILLGRRPGLHLDIARALLATDREIADTRPEVLAHHFQEGGSMLQASECFHNAGLRAASRAANVEAGVHFRAAIRALETLPESPDRHGRELGARVELGLTVTALKGYAAVEVSEVYERARNLCSMLGNNAALFPVLRGLCTYYMMRNEFTTALELAHECARIGDETQRPDHRIEARAAIGYTLVYLGKLAEGRHELEAAVAAYRGAAPEYATAHTVRHGVLATLAMIAIVAWMQGEHEYSAECSRESMDIANATGRPFDLAYAYCFAAMLANLQGDAPRGLAHADRGIAVASEHAFNDWLAAGNAQRAISRIVLGHAGESRPILEKTAALWQATGAELNVQVFLAGLAAAHLAMFDLASALKRIDESIAHTERFSEHWLDAELYRLRGMILDFSGQSATAADSYRRAVRIALDQQAPFLALRSALALCACDRKAGRASDAAQIMATIVATLPPEARKAPEFAAAQRLLPA